MNPVWKERWLKALRGGDYKQGKGALREGDKFCCLGVLCDVVDPDGWAKVDESTGRGDLLVCQQDRHRGCIIGPGTFVADTTDFTDADSTGRLMTMNDSGFTFRHIADWIEENL